MGGARSTFSKSEEACTLYEATGNKRLNTKSEKWRQRTHANMNAVEIIMPFWPHMVTHLNQKINNTVFYMFIEMRETTSRCSFTTQ